MIYAPVRADGHMRCRQAECGVVCHKAGRNLFITPLLIPRTPHSGPSRSSR
jgi:hypothetical protein